MVLSTAHFFLQIPDQLFQFWCRSWGSDALHVGYLLSLNALPLFQGRQVPRVECLSRTHFTSAVTWLLCIEKQG